MNIQEKIGSYKICVDQGFPQSGDAFGVLVGPVTKRVARCLHRDVRDYILKISNVHTSLCQASKWGMRGLQGTFPWCKKCLPSNSLKHRLVIESIVLLYNFWMDTLGTTRLRQFLTQSILLFRILKVMIGLHSITFAQETMVAKLMGVEVTVGTITSKHKN
jgi:hypothetical protein